MAASSSDLFMEVGDPGTATTLSAPGYTIGGTSLTVGSTANWPTTTGVIFAMDEVETVDGVETEVEGSYNEYAGVVASGTSITGVTHVRGTDQNFAAGTSTRVYIPVSAERENRIAQGMVAEHNQDGTHAAVTATSLSVSGATTHTGTTSLTGALTVKSYDGYISSPDTWTYASATTFTIAGVDRTAQFPVGTKVKLTQTTAKYFYVTASAFSTDTTVTVTGGSDYSLANAAITSPSYSYDSTPQGFPSVFNWSPTWANTTVGNGTVVATFKMIGKTVFYKNQLTWGSTTSNSVDLNTTFSMPVTSATSGYTATKSVLGDATYFDTSASVTNPGVGVWGSSTTIQHFNWTVSTYVHLNRTDHNDPFIWTTGDVFYSQGTYEAA